jgi:3-dehydroquinate synthase
MNLGEDSYDIIVQRGILAKAKEHLNLNRRVLVVTDSGVPEEYAQTIAGQCKEGFICTVPMGEESKSLTVFEQLLHTMLEHGFSRKDCVVAVGGGVVGDLSGFAASAYMRGIDFYNIPTTLLSQIDSSIGGKTAINFGGVKNIVGAFYQPKKVLIDPQLLETLPQRQIANGLAEAIKMSLTSDKELFELIENKEIASHMDDIIIRSLTIKKNVVEQDEKEAGLRKILNFGHTIGHAIEKCSDFSISHGSAVAIGIALMARSAVKQGLCPKSDLDDIISMLKSYSLPTECDYSAKELADIALNDKKRSGGKINLIVPFGIGDSRIHEIDVSELEDFFAKGL